MKSFVKDLYQKLKIKNQKLEDNNGKKIPNSSRKPRSDQDYYDEKLLIVNHFDTIPYLP